MGRVVLGVDPGRSAGLALVQQDRGCRPTLLWSGNVFGQGRASKTTSVKQEYAWCKRLDGALEALRLRAPDGLTAAYIEEPTGGGVRNRRQKKRGPDWLLRMGGFQDMFTWAIRAQFGIHPEKVTTKSWTSIVGVPPGKITPAFGQEPAGWHRCREAAFFVDGYEVPGRSNATQDEREVAVAEAILIAVAGCTLEGGR